MTLWRACLVAAVALYVAVFVQSWGRPDSVGISNRLADAIVHGQLHLRQRPDPRLLALKDPYDPHQNAAVVGKAFDLALYHGRLYPYWGPVPALLTFVPAHLVGLGNVSEPIVNLLWALAFVGLAALVIREIAGRWAPRAPPWAPPLAFLAVVVCSGMLTEVERPGVYTLAVAAGATLLTAALFALLRAVRPEGRADRRLLAAGSLALGLAVGARWSLAPAALALAVLLVVLARREREGRASLALAILGPVAVCVVLLGLYNLVRFDSPLQTGNTLTLVGWRDVHADGITASPGWRAVLYYLLRPADLVALFPYTWLNSRPISGYDFQDPMVGLLWTAPIILLGPVAVVVLRTRARALALLTAALVAVGVVLFLPNAAYLFASRRYAADFAVPLAFAGAAGALGLLARPRRRRVRRRLLVVTAAVTGVLVLFNLMLSANVLIDMRPATNGSIDSALSGLPTAYATGTHQALMRTVDGAPARSHGVFESIVEHRPYVLSLYAPHGTRAVVLRIRLQEMPGVDAGAYQAVARTDSGGAPAVAVPPVVPGAATPLTAPVTEFTLPVEPGRNEVRLEIRRTRPVPAAARRVAVADVSARPGRGPAAA